MRKKAFLPFLLTISIVVLDQITKALVVRYIPINTVFASFFSDFLRIVHVRNTAVAFSIGSSLPYMFKVVFFIVLPLLVLVALSYYLVKARDEDLSVFERFALAGIVGGGLGNILDRIFRHMSVVDFISTNNYGLFGMERFPTYNLADAAVVISVILFLLSAIFTKKEKR